MPAPTISIPVAGAQPATATKEALEKAVNAALSELSARIDLGGTDLTFAGSADLSGGFPSGTSLGDFFITNDGVVDGQRFVAGDLLVATTNAPSTTVFEDNWARVPYTTAPRVPFVLAMDGQSNAFIRRDYSWVPPVNLLEWNYDRTESGTGTEFEPADPTKMSAGLSLAAAIARANPMLDVNLVNIGWPSVSIDHWSGGLKYLFDETSTPAEPAPGYMKLNAANPFIATKIRVNKTDSNGVNRTEALLRSGFDDCTFVRFEDVNDPTVYADYTPDVSSLVLIGDTYEIDVTIIARNGDPVTDDEMRYRIGPDVASITDRNLTAALAAVGAESLDLFAWWQGESNALHPENYILDFEEMREGHIDAGHVKAQTPIVIFGIADESILDGNIRVTEFNLVQQRLANADAQNRLYVNTSSLPLDLWTGNHMLAAGYFAAGVTAANQLQGGTGFKTNPSFSVDTVSGQVFFEPGSAEAPAFGFANYDGDTTGFYRAGERAAGFNGNLEVAAESGFSGTHSFEADNALTVTFGRSGDNATAAQVYTEKSRGTMDAPTAVAGGDNLGQFVARGFDGTAMRAAGNTNIVMRATTPSDTDFEAEYTIRLCPAGSSSTAEIFAASHEEGLSIKGNPFIDGDRIFRSRGYTVATLPAAGVAGRFTHVTDASSTTRRSTVSGGGSNITVVFDDGANWIVV